RLSLVSFFGETKKETAPPGAHPGLQRHQEHYAFNSCLRPPQLGKAPISLRKWQTMRQHAPGLRQACPAPAEGLSPNGRQRPGLLEKYWRNQPAAQSQRAQTAIN
ncbi:MAG: hypothetical protein KDF56_16515, partial [Ottowia sp.]|nr:hypothetical protein [Ottowia sp.]